MLQIFYPRSNAHILGYFASVTRAKNECITTAGWIIFSQNLPFSAEDVRETEGANDAETIQGTLYFHKNNVDP